MLVLLCLVLSIGCCACQDDPVVDTVYGSIRGTTGETYDGRLYEEFLGIPYATPPLDDGRFTQALPPESWGEIRDTKEYSPHCVQFPPKPFLKDGLSNETSEDCLYLNIYVPGTNRAGSNLAVMVYIHGGAFLQGTGALYPGYELGLHGDVVVVTFNYRLGPLGWLSTEDEAAPGNYAMWDVKLALEWVRDNVEAFGGNPERVTAFGLSAGGVMTSLTMISPYTDDLIQRGAALSGTSSGFFGTALPGAVLNSTETLARTVGCRRLNTSEELVDCLREVDAFDLNYWGFISVVTFRRQLPNFMPVIDGDFIPTDPSEMWSQGAAANKDYIAGATVHDSASMVMPNVNGTTNHTFNLAGSKDLMQTSMKLVLNHFPGDFDEMEDAIFMQYPDLESNDTTTRTQAMVTASTDGVFDTWAHYEISQHSRTSAEKNSYLYEYAHSNSFLKLAKNVDHDWVVAQHADDLFSVFGEPFRQVYRENELNGEYDESDKLVRDYVMSYYTNFANNGNPNIGLDVPTEWTEFNTTQKEYLEISSTPQLLQETEEMIDNYQFWNHEFSEISMPEEMDILAIDEEEFERALQGAIASVNQLIAIEYEDEPEELLIIMDKVNTALKTRKIRIGSLDYNV